MSWTPDWTSWVKGQAVKGDEVGYVYGETDMSGISDRLRVTRWLTDQGRDAYIVDAIELEGFIADVDALASAVRNLQLMFPDAYSCPLCDKVSDALKSFDDPEAREGGEEG